MTRRPFGQIDHLCSGTLVKRKKICGKASCRCLRDPGARHGPYYELSISFRMSVSQDFQLVSFVA